MRTSSRSAVGDAQARRGRGRGRRGGRQTGEPLQRSVTLDLVGPAVLSLASRGSSATPIKLTTITTVSATLSKN